MNSFSVSTQVAFTASAAGGTQTDGGIITFDNVITNFGSSYDGINTFTCPADGIYAFTVTHMGQEESVDAMWFIMVDGVSTVLTKAHVGMIHNQASNLVVAFCSAGGQVYVQSASAAYVWGTVESTFSGFLIGITAS